MSQLLLKCLLTIVLFLWRSDFAKSFAFGQATTHNVALSLSATASCKKVTVDTDNPSWIQTAANHLRSEGVCALVGNNLLSTPICDETNRAATSRLEDLHRRIRNRGVDPSGVADGPYRFLEVVCRDGSPRFDMPVPWLGQDKDRVDLRNHDFGMPLTDRESDVMRVFHEELDRIVEPVMDALFSADEVHSLNSSDRKSFVAAAGFLVNQPGSKSQAWHRDGPDEGYIDVFVPLVDLTHSLGPTSILPGTHTASDANPDEILEVVPLLQKGEILLFDYRTLHRGLGNTSPSDSRTLAYAVYTNGLSSDMHNFPDALTLEYD